MKAISNNNLLVSVIIPAYNHEKYIQETIFSIINQTYNNIELLIIDDGSNDATYDRICEMEIRCKKRFARFDFVKQKNMGIIDTLNSLIYMSEGKYVYFIASDDVAAPHAIETELNFLLDNSDYALCVGYNDIIDKNSIRHFWDKNRNNLYDVTDAHYFSFSDSLMKDLPTLHFFSDDFGLYYNLVYYGNHIPNGYLIRKAIFKKTGHYKKEAPLEDYWMMMQIAKYSKMKYLRDTLFFYRWHDKNTINTINKWDQTYKTLLYELQGYPEICEIRLKDRDIEIKPEEFEGKIKIVKSIFKKYYIEV